MKGGSESLKVCTHTLCRLRDERGNNLTSKTLGPGRGTLMRYRSSNLPDYSEIRLASSSNLHAYIQRNQINQYIILYPQPFIAHFSCRSYAHVYTLQPVNCYSLLATRHSTILASIEFGVPLYVTLQCHSQSRGAQAVTSNRFLPMPPACLKDTD